jgi:tungstate transport system substrate-binding protein
MYSIPQIDLSMSIQRREFLSALGGCGLVGVSGCLHDATAESQPTIVGDTLTLTTTTSTYDTGLLNALNASFETRFGVTVNAVAQGTGAALETAKNGDSDVVMVHARSLEDEFIREGYGINRRDLMFNDFVIVGPTADPAHISSLDSAIEAFASIAGSESTFVSRGDMSGTHAKELAIWDAAGIDPTGSWYLETGQGMGEVLNITNEQDGYTLTDRGTFLSQRSELTLVILVDGPIEGGPQILANPYGIIAVNPAVHSNVNYDLAMAYIGFVTSPEGQEIIENFEVNGEQLFFPQALSEDPDFHQYVPEGWRAASDD